MVTLYDAEGNPVEVDDNDNGGPAGLRKELKERKEELENLKSQLADLLNEKRTREAEDALKGFDPKVKEFVNEFGLDPNAVAEKWGDLFKPSTAAPAEEQSVEEEDPAAAQLREQFAAMADLAQGAETSPKQVTQQEAGLQKAAGDLTDPAAIAAYMRSIGAAV